MKKLLLILLLTLLLVSSVSAFNIQPETFSPITLNSGSSAALNFRLVLEENEVLAEDTPMNVSSLASATTSLILNPGTIIPFRNGTSQSITLNMPSNADQGTYAGTFKVEGGSQTKTKSFTITVPEVRNAELKLNNAEVSTINLESGEDQNELVFSLKNTGNADLTNVQVSAVFTTLTDNDGDVITITEPVSIASMTRDETKTVTFNFDVESSFDVGSLPGNIRVTGDGVTVKDFPVTLSVKPLVCQANSRVGDLDLEVEKPDDSANVERGEIVEVELDLENNGNQDVDSRVMAVLYNKEKQRKEDSATINKNINDDDSERFNFNLETGDNIDDGDKFTLYLKAFDRDNELNSCILEEIDFEIEVPDHKINIENIVLSPTVLSCSSQVAGSALLRNVGDNEEDVIVEIYNTQIGLNKRSNVLTLDKEEEQLVNFEFTIPVNTPAGTYPIYLKADYDETTIATQPITVAQCGSSDNAGITTSDVGSNLNTRTNAGTADSNVEYSERNLFDLFNKPDNKIPTSVLILVDVLLVLLIIGSLAWLFRSR